AAYPAPAPSSPQDPSSQLPAAPNPVHSPGRSHPHACFQAARPPAAPALPSLSSLYDDTFPVGPRLLPPGPPRPNPRPTPRLSCSSLGRLPPPQPLRFLPARSPPPQQPQHYPHQQIPPRSPHAPAPMSRKPATPDCRPHAVLARRSLAAQLPPERSRSRSPLLTRSTS